MKLQITPPQPFENEQLFSANGSQLNILGRTEIDIRVGGLLLPIDAIVVSQLTDQLILGTTFMKKYNVILDFQSNQVSICDDLVRTGLYQPSRKIQSVHVSRAICINPQSECIVPVTVSKQFASRDLLMEEIPGEQFRKIAIARAMVHPNHLGETVCRVLNCTDHAVVLRKNQQIATVSTLNVKTQCRAINLSPPASSNSSASNNVQGAPKNNAPSPEYLEQFAREYGFKISTELTAEQRMQLLTLLHKYKRTFARTFADIRGYKGEQLDIKTKPHRPFYTRQFKMTEPDRIEAQRQIDELKQHGLVEKSQSSLFNSPIFMVAKSNNQRRLICDLRRVNDVVIGVNVQLPAVHDLVEQVAQTRPAFMTTLDLFSGYFQVKVKPSSRPLLSFTSPQGERLQWAVCPFGLCQSPAQFLTVVYHTFSKLLATGQAFLYVDDLLLASSSFKMALQLLEQALDIMDKADLVCNGAKSTFMASNLNYLGFNISQSGYTLRSDRLRSLEQWSSPTDCRSLKRTLAHFNFYRRFLHRFAHRTYHMRQLLQHDTDFVWDTQCETDFRSLVDDLLKRPILQPWNPNAEAVIYCDASDVGAGAILLQRSVDDDKLHPVAFLSQAFTKSQLNYTIAQKELLSLALCLKAYQHLLITQDIIVFTDNTSVLHFLTQQSPIGARERRLFAYIMQFKLHLKFVESAKNQSDYLSRLPSTWSDAIKIKYTATDEDFVMSLKPCLIDWDLNSEFMFHPIGIQQENCTLNANAAEFFSEPPCRCRDAYTAAATAANQRSCAHRSSSSCTRSCASCYFHCNRAVQQQLILAAAATFYTKHCEQ